MFGLIHLMKHMAPGKPMDTPQGTQPMTPVAPNQGGPSLPSTGFGALDFLAGRRNLPTSGFGGLDFLSNRQKLPTSGFGAADLMNAQGLVPTGRPLVQWGGGQGQGPNPSTTTTEGQPVVQAQEGMTLGDLLRHPNPAIRKQALQMAAVNMRDRGRKAGPLSFGLLGMALSRRRR